MISSPPRRSQALGKALRSCDRMSVEQRIGRRSHPGTLLPHGTFRSFQRIFTEPFAIVPVARSPRVCRTAPASACIVTDSSCLAGPGPGVQLPALPAHRQSGRRRGRVRNSGTPAWLARRLLDDVNLVDRRLAKHLPDPARPVEFDSPHRRRPAQAEIDAPVVG